MSIEWVKHALEDGPDDPLERFVYLAIGERVNKDDPLAEAWPSVADTMARTRLSKSTVLRCIKSMEKAGWMEVRKGHGPNNSSHYFLKKVPQRHLSNDEKVSHGHHSEDSKRCQSDPLKVSRRTRKGVCQTFPPHPHIGRTRNEPEVEPGAQPIPQTDYDSFPEGFDHMKYANAILERNSIPNVWSIRNALAEAIRAFSRWRDKIPLHLAAQEMERLMLAAEQRGETINQHWLGSDQKWKRDGGLNGTTQGHRGIGATGSAARVERSLSAWDRARAERDAARMPHLPKFRLTSDAEIEAEERNNYATWLTTSEQYKRENPWKGRVFA
jgi:hypothetical protein